MSRRSRGPVRAERFASCAANWDSRRSASTGSSCRPTRRVFEHDESGTGQEEINVVVAGSGVWRVDGQEVPARVGTFLRFDPETTRQPVAGPDGMTFIGVGARRGSYEPHGPF